MADLIVAIHDDLSSSVSVELSDPEIPVQIGYNPGDEIPGPTGPEGKRVQLRNNGTAIQWKYFDDVAWTHLIDNDDLIPPGSGVTLPINISDVTGLDDALNGKAPSIHTHTIAEIATLSTVLSQIQTAITNLQSTNVAFVTQLDANTNAINTEVYDREQAIIHLQSYIAGVQNSLVNDINALWTHMNAIEAFRDLIDANSDGIVNDSDMLGGKVADDYALKTYVDAAIEAIVNGSPALLDTLQELATALGNDENFATTMATALAGKEPAISSPGDASKVWDGTKVFRPLTTSDIPGLSAAIANRKSPYYYKRSTGWYNNAMNALAFSVVNLTANSANVPLNFLVIEEVTVITDIAVEVTTAGSAGSLLHFGLFQVTNPDATPYNNGPLVANTTTGVASDSLGVKSLTLPSPITLQPGLYLVGVSTNSTTALGLRALAVGAMPLLYGNVSPSGLQISSLLGSRASFAALPSNLSAFTTITTVSSTNGFVFWYKKQ